MLILDGNIAITYESLGRLEEALRLRRDSYSGFLKLHGDEHGSTLRAAHNYVGSLVVLNRFDEAKSLSRKLIPVARRVLGENEITLAMNLHYAMALYADDDATLDELREAVTTLEETERITRRVMGGAHPLAMQIELELRNARAALRARETLSSR